MYRLQADLRQKGLQALRLAVAAGAAVTLDQITKAWTLARLAPVEARPVVVVPGYLRLEYATNPGAAFSLFHEHPGVLTVLALALALAVLAWGIFFLKPHERVAHVAAGMIFGGAVGNLIDRFRFGHVVDFIVAHWGERAWPTFNIADAAICVGVGVLIVVLGRASHDAVPEAAGKAGAAPGAGAPSSGGGHTHK